MINLSDVLATAPAYHAMTVRRSLQHKIPLPIYDFLWTLSLLFLAIFSNVPSAYILTSYITQNRIYTLYTFMLN